MTRQEEDKMVTTALNRLGMDLTTVSDLIKWKGSYRAAIPVLLTYLPRVQDHGIREAIVRALTVKEARGKVDAALIAEFRRVRGPKANIGLKWAIANALSVVATDTVFSDLVALVKNREHGKSREMLALALGNIQDPGAIDVLIGLLNDEEVAGHALMALGKLKAKRARSEIERFLNHDKLWVRKEAQKALAKIEG